MIEIKGKHNTAVCFTDELEPAAEILKRIVPVYNFKAGE